MEVTFEGIPSGDHECFTWAVDRETFIRVVGQAPDEEFDRSRFHDGLYDLYPSTAMTLFGKEQWTSPLLLRGRKLRFTLKIEDVPEEEGSTEEVS